MARPTVLSAPRTIEEIADAVDLRAVITTALDTDPVDEVSLRRGVWTHVGAERRAGTSPGRVIMELTDLIEAAAHLKPADRQTLLRRTILWCVEAYFGKLGGDVVDRDGSARADRLPPVSAPPIGGKE